MKKLISLLFIISISFAQQQWIRTYGSMYIDDVGQSVRQTSDEGYIIVGSTGSWPSCRDVFLIKTDSTGDTLWTKTYGGSNDDDGYSVQQTSDGGYIIVGSTLSYGAGWTDLYLIKTDSVGDTIWTKTYGEGGDDYGRSVQQTLDGGYIITGSAIRVSNYEAYLIKTDAFGDSLWTKTYGGTSDDYGCWVQQTSDSGYVVVGYTWSFGAGNEDVYLIKTNAQGNILWTKTYGGVYWERGHSVQQTSDGGYIIGGYTSSFTAGNEDYYLIKTNDQGDTLWTRHYGGGISDYGYTALQTSDGGYIITGTTKSFASGASDVWFIKTNTSGDSLWSKIYGGMDSDNSFDIQQTSDGGYVIVGSTLSDGTSFTNVYLIKTDANGNAAVEERKKQNLEVKLIAVPNPFSSFTRIPGYEKQDFVLADITGRVVGKYKGEKIGGNLSTGVYFVIPQDKNLKPIRIVKIR